MRFPSEDRARFDRYQFNAAGKTLIETIDLLHLLIKVFMAIDNKKYFKGWMKSWSVQKSKIREKVYQEREQLKFILKK